MSQTQSTATAASLAGQWRKGYDISPGVYDEMFSEAGELRPHWKPLATVLDQMGPVELARRWEMGRRLIHENGVTYNVYGDPRGMDRPWELDAIPLLIAEAEWKTLETALAQRARLLNLILTDLYGPQALLRAGVIPPELVFSHPGFLRACHGIRVPNNCHLHLYAADIARNSTGKWSVLADRTQAPSGAGYALENRIVLKRLLPDGFKESQVQRLATFFQTIRDTLSSLASYNRDNPRIVLLTPGPEDSTYFEHAYLARYLNYTLAEAGDLTVRDQTVFLKTLGGLHRVDVILRRMDDEYCDPLELRAESVLGVPGLIQAARVGNVAIANPLGSGLVETSAMIPFLPALCKHLLNEELKLPSVESFWCGNPKSLAHVIANFTKLVIKNAFPSKMIEPVFGEKLSSEQRAELLGRIQANPHLYVAQEQVSFATAPVITHDRLQPRCAVLRTFLAASNGGYAAMPGGLTQVPHSSDSLIFSLQRGGGSKDTWVHSSGPVSNFSLLRPAGQTIELSRGGGDLPSRVADNLFWLGRYVERAESAIRLLRCILLRLSDRSELAEGPLLPALISAFKHLRITSAGVESRTPEAPSVRPLDELKTVLAECRRAGSLYPTLDALHDVAKMVRDRLSTDTWRVLTALSENMVGFDPAEDTQIGEVLAWTNFMVIRLASFGGLASESMTRGQVWRFLDMGRRLERGINMVSLLRSTLIVECKDEPPLLEALLEIADSSMTYRRRYLASLQLAPVLDLLLADDSNPRSLVFQLAALHAHVDNLPRDKAIPHLNPEMRITLGALSSVRLMEIDSLCEARRDGVREKLDTLLAQLDSDLPALSESVTRNYLSHETSRQLSSMRSEVVE